MTCLRDEVLVDYADNRLSIDKRRAVEHVLAIDTEARHKVALFKLSAYLLRQAFAGIDFTGVPAWLDVLFQRYDQRAAGMRRAGWWTCVWRTGGRLPSGWAALRLSLASSLLLGICLGGLTAVVTTPSDGSERLLVLGELAPASALVEALDHVSETGADWTGPGRWRAAGVANFKDRFGNECREVEFYATPSSGVPAQIVVACRGAADKWSLVGAVSNQVSGAPISSSAITAYYVPTDDAARPSLASIMSMLGAQQRRSTMDRNVNAP